jgi:hypothetical protein
MPLHFNPYNTFSLINNCFHLKAKIYLAQNVFIDGFLAGLVTPSSGQNVKLLSVELPVNSLKQCILYCTEGIRGVVCIFFAEM